MEASGLLPNLTILVPQKGTTLPTEQVYMDPEPVQHFGEEKISCLCRELKHDPLIIQCTAKLLLVTCKSNLYHETIIRLHHPRNESMLMIKHLLYNILI